MTQPVPSSQSYDLVVIAGPGGYVAAIRAAQLGLKTACIDKESKFGGTCCRVGCIPSKALLDASEKFAHAKHSYGSLGIKFDNIALDLATMMARKDKVVDTLTSNVKTLVKKKGAEPIVGTATFVSPTQIKAKAPDGSESLITSKNFLIATGSAVIELPFLKFNGTTIVSSDHAIGLKELPKTMVVVGAGVIGLELGSVWSRLGAKVTVLEMLPVALGGGADEEMANGLQRVLKKQGLEFFMGAKVTGSKTENGQQMVTFEWEGKPQSLPADVILVAVGRKPYTEALGAAEIGIKLDERKRVAIDKNFRTSVPNIYAIGDVVAGPMLAHKAEEEGIACVENLAGKHGHVNYNVIPAVVYTNPELAWVGKTEAECAAAGIATNIGKFKFAANGRALCMDETDGFVKIIADAKTDRVLGMHILGPQASSMIVEGATIMEFGGSAEDIARTCHAHPTLPEAIKEAAMAVDKRQIHSF